MLEDPSLDFRYRKRHRVFSCVCAHQLVPHTEPLRTKSTASLKGMFRTKTGQLNRKCRPLRWWLIAKMSLDELKG